MIDGGRYNSSKNTFYNPKTVVKPNILQPETTTKEQLTTILQQHNQSILQETIQLNKIVI